MNSRSEKIFQNFVTISTTRNEDFTFSCTNAEDIKGKILLGLNNLIIT